MKKLENEYRQLMQSETPDLWSRIEAGIDAQIAEKEPSVKRKAGVNLWKKYSLPLVACIAAVLCVPLLLTGFLRMASGGKAETTEMAADFAAADCAAPEETTSVTADCAAPEETTSVTTDCADEPAAAVVTEGTCDEEIDDAFAEKESALAEDLKGLLQVLTVTQISQGSAEFDENREKGVVYYLTTEEAGECTLFVPTDAEFTVDMNTQLKIRVKLSNEDCDYVFVEMAE